MSRFLKVIDAIDLGLLGNSDYQKRDRLRLAKWAKFVWSDMNLTTVKIARRELFTINKRLNSIDLPCEFSQLSSVNVVDKNGIIYPVFRNDNLKGSDIVEVGAAKDCACEFKCGYQLCNTIKGYEAITSIKTDKTPDGDDISFTCVDRKCVDSSGFLYEELQYPLRQYESGVWTETVLHTERNKLCAVEVDSNGCCCDSENNIENVCNACGITKLDQKCVPLGGTSVCPPNTNDDTWIYWCSTKLDWFSIQCGCFPYGFKKGCNNIYNISELGNRLIFPANFGWDRVLIRYYIDTGLNDLVIPMICIDTFIVGLKWWDCRFNDNKQVLAKNYEADYTKLKWGLLLELNKYRLQEQRMIMTPRVYVPSFNIQNNHTNNYNDGN